jgi:adenosylcobinamide-phosphate synthase
MSFLALIFALVIEQLRPVVGASLWRRAVHWGADGLARRLDDGSMQAGRLAWLVVVVPLTVATALGFWALAGMHPLLAFLFDVAVLVACFAFRRDGRFFNEIHAALRLGELESARALLGDWRGVRYDEAAPGEVATLAIEQGLVAAHRTVFGVIFWFVLLPGPSGAVMYRVAALLAARWGRPREGAFGTFAQRAFAALDWAPARLTALVFSVVGNFEDAVYCWRSQAVLWPDRSSAILLASGGGALGVKLGRPVHEAGVLVDRPEMGLGDEAGVDHLQATVGLLWRALLVCMFLLALLAVASWAGG